MSNPGPNPIGSGVDPDPPIEPGVDLLSYAYFAEDGASADWVNLSFITSMNETFKASPADWSVKINGVNAPVTNCYWDDDSGDQVYRIIVAEQTFTQPVVVSYVPQVATRLRSVSGSLQAVISNRQVVPYVP